MKDNEPWLPVGIAGLGVGWLVGLSVSPVVASVIATLLGAAAALSGGSDRVDKLGKGLSTLLSAVPMASLAVGVAIGATLGLKARTSGWFQPITTEVAELEPTVRAWEALGVDRNEVVERLLDRHLPVGGVASGQVAGTERASMPAGLVTISASACAELLAVEKSRILQAMTQLPDSRLQQLGDEATRLGASPEFADALRSALCPNP